MQTEETTFEALGLSQPVLEALAAKGFTHPTPVQALTIPALMRNDRDLVASAQTGTGKTAAFGIPLIERLKRGAAPQALVMTPTRELAIQVAEEMASLQPGRGGLRFVTVYGGQSISAQAHALNRGADIVVGTPGRIKDMLSRGVLDLSSVRWFILDEADEMLKMGFIEDVEEILSAAHPERRVLLFSATMPKPILQLAEQYLTNYELLTVQSPQRTSHLTRQYAMQVPRNSKGLVLCRLIDSEPNFYGLIFAPTRDLCDEISYELNRRGFAAEALHGDISQPMREKVLSRFRERRIKILVATDVAARGIDIHEITHVVNFEPPREVDLYVHRVGRTGRAGKEGIAVTLIEGRWDYRRLEKIRQMTRTEIKELPIPTVEEIVQSKRKALAEEIRRAAEGGVHPATAHFSEELLQNFSPSELVSTLLDLGWSHTFNTARHPDLPFEREGRREMRVERKVRREQEERIRKIPPKSPKKSAHHAKKPAVPAATVDLSSGKPLTRAQRRAIQFGHILDKEGNIVATRGVDKKKGVPRH